MLHLLGVGMGKEREKIFDLSGREWKPPGPVAKAFIEDVTTIAPFITGPVGSGKSTAADVVKTIFKAMQQKPDHRGERNYRNLIFRATQRAAWESTIPTFSQWIPFDVGTFRGSQDRPCSFKFKASHPEDHKIINIEVKWLGMPDNLQSLENALKGVETTDINFAEADQLPLWGFEYCLGRRGRFPSRSEMMFPQLWGSFNPGDYDSWLYELLVNEETKKAGAKLYQQPPGLKSEHAPFEVNPAAENLDGLPNPNYYVEQAGLQRPGYIRRNLMAQFGPIEAEGFAVYPEFVAQDHIVDMKTRDDWLYLGFDGGGTPAATILQWGEYGSLDTIDEVVLFDPLDEKKRKLKSGVGPTEFGEACLRVLARYDGLKIRVAYGDPSAWNSGGQDYSFASRLAQVLNCKVEPAPAPNNSRIIREEANRIYLGKRGVGGLPMRRYNPRVRWLLQGMKGAFEYDWQTKSGVLVPSDKRAVIKNPWSHTCEADEYGACGMTGGGRILRLPPPPGLILPKSAPQQYKEWSVQR